MVNAVLLLAREYVEQRSLHQDARRCESSRSWPARPPGGLALHIDKLILCNDNSRLLLLSRPQSVHVMVKHDKDVAKRRGVPAKPYRPSASLSALVAASNKRQVDAVEVTEDESSDDIGRLLENDGAHPR